MERKTNLKEAEKIMSQNFIGLEQLSKIKHHFPILIPDKIPAVPFNEKLLTKLRRDYILVLGISKDKNGKALTVNRMREIFGIDPKKSEPCFYNQDWYLKEDFASKTTLDLKWYLIRRNVDKKTRGLVPDSIKKSLKKEEQFPPAVLCAFTFFAYYLLNKGKILWEKDFIWCQDKDLNGDRIYVGRYKDPKKINKNGFNVHRHLSIKKSYGLSSQLI